MNKDGGFMSFNQPDTLTIFIKYGENYCWKSRSLAKSQREQILTFFHIYIIMTIILVNLNGGLL